MSESPRALRELMMAVDAGHAVDLYVDSASSDSSKLLGPRHRPSTYYGRRVGGARKSAPAAVAVVEASPDASFEFSTAVNSYSSASPASMVFADGQIRAHQFPPVAVAARSSASMGSSQATSPLRSSSVGSSSYGSTKRQQAAVTGSKKRVSFAKDGADKAAAADKADGGQGMKKSGGLLGCMGSPCGPSSRNNEAVEPVARNVNRKVVSF